MRIALVWPCITTLHESESYYNVQAYGLANNLARHDFDVGIFTSNRILHSNGENRKKNGLIKVTRDNYRVFYLSSFLGSSRFPVMPSLIKELRVFAPDVVQSAESLSPSTLAAFYYAKFYHKPFFVYQGVYEHPAKFRRYRRLLERTVLWPLYKYTDCFLTKSTAARHYLIHCGVPQEKVRVVYVGFTDQHFFCEPGHFLNELTGFSKNRVIILSVGRLLPRKNHRFIIDALLKVRDVHPELALAILGTGPELKSLQEYILNKGLKGSACIVSKRIRQDEMRKVYSSAFVYLCPSLHEIFGMTLLEAMACRKPVIGSPVGGMKDIILHGENGFLVDPRNVEDLCKYIIRLLSNAEMYEKLSANAFATSQKFTWDTVGQNFSEAFEEVCIVR